MTQASIPRLVIGAHQMVGHAIVQSLFRPGSVTEVTIRPRDRSDMGAFMAFNPGQPRAQTADDIRNEGIMALAGVIAARELTGSVDGCSASFIKGNCIATRYVDLTEPQLEGTRRLTRIAEVVENWTAASVELVRANEDKIRRVAGVLLEKETLTAAEFSTLVG